MEGGKIKEPQEWFTMVPVKGPRHMKQICQEGRRVEQLGVILALLLEIIRNNDQSHDYKRELVRFDLQITQNLVILYNCCLKHDCACQTAVLTITGTIFYRTWS